MYMYEYMQEHSLLYKPKIHEQRIKKIRIVYATVGDMIEADTYILYY